MHFSIRLCHFPRVYYGISEYIEMVLPSQVKLDMSGGIGRFCMNICLKRDISHATSIPFLLSPAEGEGT